MKIQPFHLAIPVKDLKSARNFYTNTLELEEGRSSEHWIDYNFFGHQLVIHQSHQHQITKPTNVVDLKEVPIPHFGVVLDWDEFYAFAEKLKSKGITFEIEPYIRFKGEVGEQATMFFYDCCGNALEFKAFKDIRNLFSK
ncbi:VOC family protein [Mesonia sp. K7]|uniref:VOC family protein n=1 Tax=Mesonia sp. K7 TaxID=2218606 RepID=UPI000DAA531B|nr:VOC family protein [Mesonia sp. K7]PZD77585.1 glyoxalase [Mesonia sp. K7]